MSKPQSVIKPISELLPDYFADQEKPKPYWQERALFHLEKLKVDKKDYPIFFRYFRKNVDLMNAICAYVEENTIAIRNPTAYVLWEYKRRHKS